MNRWVLKHTAYSWKQSICINKGFNYLNSKSGKFEFHFSEYLVIIYTRVKELHISWSLHVPCSASVGPGNSTKAWSERLWRGSQDQWKNHARLFFIDFSTACNCILPHLLWSSYPTLTWTLILSVGWGDFLTAGPWSVHFHPLLLCHRESVCSPSTSPCFGLYTFVNVCQIWGQEWLTTMMTTTSGKVADEPKKMFALLISCLSPHALPSCVAVLLPQWESRGESHGSVRGRGPCFIAQSTGGGSGSLVSKQQISMTTAPAALL